MSGHNLCSGNTNKYVHIYVRANNPIEVVLTCRQGGVLPDPFCPQLPALWILLVLPLAQLLFSSLFSFSNVLDAVSDTYRRSSTLVTFRNFQTLFSNCVQEQFGDVRLLFTGNLILNQLGF